MYRIRQYRDRRGEWRWTLFAGNGRKVAASGEGYKRLATMRRTLRRIFPWFF